MNIEQSHWILVVLKQGFYITSLTTKVVDLGERINRCLDPMVFDEHKKVLDNLWYITNLDQIDVIIVNNF